MGRETYGLNEARSRMAVWEKKNGRVSKHIGREAFSLKPEAGWLHGKRNGTLALYTWGGRPLV